MNTADVSRQRLSACRLCNGATREIFQQKILDKYLVSYQRCEACDSLQTEEPYWIEEAYRDNLAPLDTGAAHRNLNNLAASLLVATLFRCRNILDYGGGDGLLCRLLRDHGLNAYVDDKYGSPTYALAFTKPDFEAPDLVLSFEVFEHFEHPREELAKMFAMRPGAVFASTELYREQTQIWWYLAPETGQHLFFYSARALREIATAYGYQLLTVDSYHLFVRNGVTFGGRAFVLRRLLRSRMLRFLRIVPGFLPARGYAADAEMLRSRAR